MSLLADVGTVVWKEWQEMVDQVAGSTAGKLGLAGMFVFFGIFSPWTSGPQLVSSATAVFYYPVVAAMLTVQPIVDAFAGERERHTLETLLASRLPDLAILLGKLLAALSAAWVAAYAMYGAALLTASAVHGGGGFIVPPAWVLLGVGVGVLLVPTAFAAIGVFISLGSATVRQAAQVFGLTILGLSILPIVALSVLHDLGRGGVAAWVRRAEPLDVVLAAASLIALLAALFLAAAMRRFRRGRLSLD